LEDLHWADYSTLDLVAYLARRTERARILVLGSYRPLDVFATDHPLNAALCELQGCASHAELSLSHLTEPAAAEYLDRRFAQHDFPRSLARLLHERTAGNALFMLRVVDHWLERRVVRQQSGRWTLDGNLEDLSRDVPESVLAIIERETARLNPFEQSVLSAASVAGVEFSATNVACALDEDVSTVEELCVRWGRHGQFLKLERTREWPDGSVGMSFEFTHALYHQVVYEAIGATRKAKLHRRLGEIEEARHGPLASGIAAELAMHFERGQCAERAIHYSKLAGEHALRQSACREALGHFSKGLALLSKLTDSPARPLLELELELLVGRGSTLIMADGYGAAGVDQVFGRARQLCQAIGDTPHWYRVLSGLAGYYVVRGAYRTTYEIGEHLLSIAKLQTDRGNQAESHLVLGLALTYLGRLSEARAHLGQGYALYDDQRDPSQLLRYREDAALACGAHSTWALWLGGYPERALATARESLARAQQLNHPFTLAFVLNFIAMLHGFRSEPSESRQYAEELVALSEAHGFAFFLAVGRMLEGSALLELAHDEAGVALLHQGWTSFRATGAVVASTYWRALLARAHAKAGQIDAALAMLSEGMAAAQSNEERWWEPELYRLRGELLTRNADAGSISDPESGTDLPATAEACFLKALTLARQNDAKSLELRAAMSLARSWAGGPRAAEGQQALAAAYDGFDEGHATPDLQHARQLLARSSRSP
jgi:predicted ATPase